MVGASAVLVKKLRDAALRQGERARVHRACGAAAMACGVATRARGVATRGMWRCHTRVWRRHTMHVALRRGCVALPHGACGVATRGVWRCHTGVWRCHTGVWRCHTGVWRCHTGDVALPHGGCGVATRVCGVATRGMWRRGAGGRRCRAGQAEENINGWNLDALATPWHQGHKWPLRQVVRGHRARERGRSRLDGGRLYAFRDKYAEHGLHQAVLHLRLARLQLLRAARRGAGGRRHRADADICPRHDIEPSFYCPSTTFDFPRCFQVATIVYHPNCRRDTTDLALPDWVYEKVVEAGSGARKIRELDSASPVRHLLLHQRLN
jgi:hypothetical protein